VNSLSAALSACATAAKAAGRATTPPPKSLFSDPNVSAVELFIAASRHLGSDFVNFEPETLWLALDVAPVNRDKLLAAVNLATHPSFFWDFRVLGNTALAFGDHAVQVDVTPRPQAQDMAWATFEAELLNALSTEPAEPEFDDEALAYIATVLHEEGFVKAPDLLEEAQSDLDKMTSPEGLVLKGEVEKSWSDGSIRVENDALGVQVARLSEVRLYLVNRANHLTEQLRKL
jgi:hypothetical protein